jgi:hypothetical protein
MTKENTPEGEEVGDGRDVEAARDAVLVHVLEGDECGHQLLDLLYFAEGVGPLFWMVRKIMQRHQMEARNPFVAVDGQTQLANVPLGSRVVTEVCSDGPRSVPDKAVGIVEVAFGQYSVEQVDCRLLICH